MSAELAREGDLQHALIVREAQRRGIQCTELYSYAGRHCTLLELGSRAELLVQGIPTSWINMQTRFLCDYKQLTKTVFERLSIPCPRSVLFRDPEEPQVAFLFKPGKSYVCKPHAAANGLGVQMNITSLNQVAACLQDNQTGDDEFLLEEQVDGEDFRIQVIGGRIVAACVREPAFVTGDGKGTLSELIEKRREVIRLQNPANRLDLDNVARQLIAVQSLTLTSVPAMGRKVRLKAVSNMGQGGVATDITERLHPRYAEWVASIAAYIQSDYFALDLLGKAPSIDPADTAHALEINAQAEWLHHTFSEGKTHDLAAVVVSELFGS